MAGHLTALAYAGVTNSWNAAQARHNDDSIYDDITAEKARRQRLIERIRAEERTEGIDHPRDQEDKYDRWANSCRFDIA
ncbi:MAG: hypothetical protein ACLFR0_06385 [Alphaproteobacteria bacterium]